MIFRTPEYIQHDNLRYGVLVRENEQQHHAQKDALACNCCHIYDMGTSGLTHPLTHSHNVTRIIFHMHVWLTTSFRVFLATTSRAYSQRQGAPYSLEIFSKIHKEAAKNIQYYSRNAGHGAWRCVCYARQERTHLFYNRCCCCCTSISIRRKPRGDYTHIHTNTIYMHRYAHNQ